MAITTNRLILRRWRDNDREPFAAMNADPRVMEFFTALLSRSESDALIDRINNHVDQHGFGFWALEVVGVAPFVGFTGLAVADFPAHFTPSVEIGWRLARDHWGKSYASEAARRALTFGFEEAGLSEIVACAVPGNLRSRAVMERIGMRRDPADDFDHPEVPDGSPLKRHVLYRIGANDPRPS